MEDFYALVAKAIQIELEQVQLLAEAAKTAPVTIRQMILNNMMREAGEAKFWNTVMATWPHGYKKPGKHPYYSYSEPKKEKEK